jgi:hypothetical protein
MPRPPMPCTPGPMGVSEMQGIQASGYQQPCPRTTGRQVRRQPRPGTGQQGQQADRPVPARRRGRAGQSAPLWRNVSRAPWFLARRLRGAGLELQWAGTAKTVRARRGEPTARIAGPPGELLLYLFGRQGAAHVEVSGPAAAVEAVRRARFGM